MMAFHTKYLITVALFCVVHNDFSCKCLINVLWIELWSNIKYILVCLELQHIMHNPAVFYRFIIYYY